MKLYEIDPNFKTMEAQISDDMVYMEARNGPFDIYGMIKNSSDERYTRIPESAINPENKELFAVAKYTAGGRIKFSTTSDVLDIFVKYNTEIWKMPHMTLIASAGLDVYVDDNEGKPRYYGPVVPNYKDKEGYSGHFTFNPNKMHSITINMPLYADVKEIVLGLRKGCEVTHGSKYRLDDPVVFYGSSITEGGCASRPGIAYTSIIARRMNLDHVNLGFSGNAKGEQYMADYIASLNMCAFVYDYDYNAPTVEHLRNTHYPFIKTILDKHPTLPVVMVSRPFFKKSKIAEATERYEVIETTYNKLKNDGYNVAIVDGRHFFDGLDMNDCTADGTHPNDLGFAFMANKIQEALEKII